MKNFFFILAAALAFTFVSCDNEAKVADVDTTEANTTTAEKSNQLNLASSEVQDALPQTTIKWDRAEHNFGTIQEGEKVRTVFTITNTGDNPLVIDDAKGSCGCTVPKVDKGTPIAPGKTTEIEVEFNSQGRPGNQMKEVKVYGNFAPNPSVSKIQAQVEGKAKPAAGTTPTTIVDPHAGHDHD